MIRDTDNSNNQNQQPQQPAAAAAAQQANTQSQTQGQPKVNPINSQGAGAINAQFQRSGRTEGGDLRSSEALQIFNRLAEQAVASQDLQKDFVIYRFDRDQNQVGWSSLLIVKRGLVNNKDVITVRPLIMPNAAVNLPTKKLTLQNGMSVDHLEIEPDVNDVFTAKYWGRIADYVRQQLGKPGAQVINAGVTPIPADFDLKDEVRLKTLLIKSVNLCDDQLARINGEQPFSVTMLKGTDEVLATKIDSRRLPVHDTLGDPIRSDLVLTTNRQRQKGQQENEFYEADTQLNQVSLAVGLEYNAEAQQQTLYANQTQQRIPPFVPTVTITDVRNADWIKANTLELYIFGLSNAYRATAGFAWAQAFLPVVGKTKDMHDIGAVGYLSPLAAKVDTKTDQFTQQAFADLMLTMVRQQPVFLIDLDRLGDNSANEGVFIDALGGPNQQKAVSTIIKAVNNVIGGGFERFFDHNVNPIVTPYGSEVQLGYYIDENGEKQDRRNLDVLAALNLSEGNLQEWMSWYSTQLNPTIHPEVRAKQSKNFDKTYLGASTTYLRRVQRAVLSGAFIEALDKAIAAAGLQVTMDNITTVFGGQRFAGNTNIHNFAVSGVAQVQSGVTQAGGYTQQMGSAPGAFY